MLMPVSVPAQPRRPALWTALSFAPGLVLAHYVQLPLYLLLLSCALLFLIALLPPVRRRLPSLFCNVLLLVLVFCLGAVRYQISTKLLPENHIIHTDLLNQKGIVRGTITEEPERGPEQTRFVLALEEVETDSALYRVSGHILVRAKKVHISADYGDRVALRPLKEGGQRPARAAPAAQTPTKGS